MSARLIDFRSFRDWRGELVVAELDQLVPFECHRMFLVHQVPADADRGAHAHKECHQLLVAAHGRLVVDVDDGTGFREFVLDSPTAGLHLPPLTWGLQRDQSPDCVLVVLASHPYDADDYIHDHEEFLTIVKASR